MILTEHKLLILGMDEYSIVYLTINYTIDFFRP